MSIGEEHQALHRALEQLRTTFERGEGQAAARRLHGFRDLLASHFYFEEDGGYFIEVLNAAPRLGRRLQQLREEHPKLLEALERLRVIAREETPERWSTVRAGFEDLAQAILEHERQENELLQEAFSTDIGAQD